MNNVENFKLLIEQAKKCPRIPHLPCPSCQKILDNADRIINVAEMLDRCENNKSKLSKHLSKLVGFEIIPAIEFKDILVSLEKLLRNDPMDLSQN